MKNRQKHETKNKRSGAGFLTFVVGFVGIALIAAGALYAWQTRGDRVARVDDDLGVLIDLPENELPSGSPYEQGDNFSSESRDNPEAAGSGTALGSGNGPTASPTPMFSDEEQEQVMEWIAGKNKDLARQTSELGKTIIPVFARDFEFTKKVITLKKGERVKIILASLEGVHNFVVDGLNISTRSVREGEGTAVEFTPKEAGEFEYYSSIDGQREKGMTGTLRVIE